MSMCGAEPHKANDDIVLFQKRLEEIMSLLYDMESGVENNPNSCILEILQRACYLFSFNFVTSALYNVQAIKTYRHNYGVH